MTEIRDELREDLKDEEFRHAYAEESLNLRIASQLRVIREGQKMTQEELGGKIGTKQAGIARLESADYASWSIKTLKKMARAFDLRLDVSFEEFGTLWQDVESATRKGLHRRKFAKDPEFQIAARRDSGDSLEGGYAGNNAQVLDLKEIKGNLIDNAERSGDSDVVARFAGGGAR